MSIEEIIFPALALLVSVIVLELRILKVKKHKQLEEMTKVDPEKEEKYGKDSLNSDQSKRIGH